MATGTLFKRPARHAELQPASPRAMTTRALEKNS